MLIKIALEHVQGKTSRGRLDEAAGVSYLGKFVPYGPGLGRAVIWALNGRVMPRHPASTAVSLSRAFTLSLPFFELVFRPSPQVS